MDKKRIIGYYDYTVILTYLGLIFGLAGIFSAIEGSFKASVLSLVCAGICDTFDGAVASTRSRTDSEKSFGMQIDSLCDLVSFGVLPGVFIYMICGKTRISAISACFMVLCGLIRLAWYNVIEAENRRIKGEKRGSFTGLPIINSVFGILGGYLLYSLIDGAGAWIFQVIAVLLGVGFVSVLEIKKPGYLVRIVLVFIAVAALVGVMLV